ncbi:MAG: class I SAM-dependent methyltransferase [Xanthomonadales bacterium]|nr:class I SAM-dependent methyltransferase [Xanthomonadales bacterium]
MFDASQLHAALDDPNVAEHYQQWAKRIDELRITALAGGVNRGDRRALFHLIAAFKPDEVLEIGTHIGASTVYLASALASRPGAAAPTGRLTTVDIIDVNDPAAKPWLRSGSPCSPRDLLARLELDWAVEFIAQPSLTYLSGAERKFDLIFLDGDHSAATVYQEVPKALRCLNPGGLILLHDYFPNGKPLWSNKLVRLGPWLALNRLAEEGCELRVVPFGELPWETKLGSSRSSLALISSGQSPVA